MKKFRRVLFGEIFENYGAIVFEISDEECLKKMSGRFLVVEIPGILGKISGGIRTEVSALLGFYNIRRNPRRKFLTKLRGILKEIPRNF